MKNNKKKKLDSLPKIRRRILKLWANVVRERDGNTCCYCGVKHGSINSNNPASKIKCNSHHLLQKEIANCPLKYELLDGISLCCSCHKFNGEHSAHKSPIVFYDWFRNKYPDRYEFILKNSGIRIDLDNRAVLAEIEQSLIKKESLNLEKLKEIEKNCPRNPPKVKLDGNLFEEDEESSSSESS